MLLLNLAIGIYVINLGYGFEGSMQRLGGHAFVSHLLTGEDGHAVGNRFTGTLLGQLPLPLPSNYLLGMDIQRKDFEQYSRPSYLRGEFRETGWWYYYLYALGIKVPLGTWGLLVLVVLWRLFRARHGTGPTHNTTFSSGEWVESSSVESTVDSSSHTRRPTASVPHGSYLRDELMLLLPALALLAFVSSQTGFSEHMRYVLPVLPFLFVWISQVAGPGFFSGRHITAEAARGLAESRDSVRPRVLGHTAWLAVILFCWSVTSSLSVYPHNLAYFNELVGGPEGGPRHLLSSNIDWGQDLIYLKEWVEQHGNEGSLYLAYFGYFDPAHVGFDYSAPAAATGDASPVDPAGVYAISVNFLYGFPGIVADGYGGKSWYGRDALVRFRHVTPIAHARYSISIFRVPPRPKEPHARE